MKMCDSHPAAKGLGWPRALARILHEFRRQEVVAQTSSLLYRGFPIRRCDQAGTACRLEVGDTAGWKSALRSLGSPVTPLGCEISGLATLALVLLLAGCGHQPPEAGVAALPALPTASVRVQTVEAKKQVATEECVGTVRAKLQARLEAKVAGRIQEMRAVPGQLVKAGEVLARLEVQEIRAKLDQALAMQQQATNDLKRYSALLQRGAATPAEFDAVQARARVADAAASEARTMLGYAEVVAPFDGVVTRKLADVGDLAAPGKPLVDLEDPAHLRLEADIPEAIIGAVKPGGFMPVRVSGVAGELPGTVSEIAPRPTPTAARTSEARCRRLRACAPANSDAWRCRWRRSARCGCPPRRSFSSSKLGTGSSKFEMLPSGGAYIAFSVCATVLLAFRRGGAALFLPSCLLLLACGFLSWRIT